MRHLFFLIATIFLLSCSTGEKNQDQYVYWVNSSKVSCVGLAPSKCLQIQKSETLDPSEWLTFHASIKGFEFEEGYIYKLLVKETQLDSAQLPADASSIAYALVEILEKRQDLKYIINATWTSVEISGLEMQAGADGMSAPRLEIHVGEMRYSGNDGCNNYSGGIIELDEGTIRFGVAAGTRMMCMDMKIPDLFNTSLPQVTGWSINENKLHLFEADGKELMQLKKID